MSPNIEIQPSDDEPTLLVGLVVSPTLRSEVEDHLDELERLVDTAGGRVVGRLIQERPSPDPATLVGSGFVAKVASLAEEHEVQSVVFDEDLTASQIRNLEREMPKDTKVLDRAAVILDIFAARARSREARTQVELAQLNYLLPRLTRRWSHLSRQTGGIGTRGVGETQLEIDRRLVSKRIAQLKGQARHHRTGSPTAAGPAARSALGRPRRIHQRRQVESLPSAGQGQGRGRGPPLRDHRSAGATGLPRALTSRW